MRMLSNAAQKLEDGLDWIQGKCEDTAKFVSEDLRGYEFPKGYRSVGAVAGALTPWAAWTGLFALGGGTTGAVIGAITYPFIWPYSLCASIVS